jgi:heme/copper-type cytochrome/quinol oxidase subunit 1
VSTGTSPPTDVELLDHVWRSRPGFVGWLGQCNHKAVGRRFIFTAFAFLLLGGFLALVMRTQLAVPDNELVGPDGFNQLFTMHGTIMMFLFVVPMLEGFTIYVAPLALGARDMPMPRLNAFGYWVYLAGGIFLLSSFLVGSIPDSGWFAYVPLTGPDHAPGLNLDFWLLGVTMLEVSGIVAAIEVVTLVVRFRAPGMSLASMPIFVWASFIASLMILFAFPPLVAGTVLLELDRKLGTVFYDATAGGDPLLWQHLFWWFGHPEVYIQLIPALGMAASIVTVATRRRMAGRTAVIAALAAIGILSFGLWVHHMYATGIPLLATSLFTAASFMIAIPSGVIVMAFIGTMWWGRIRWNSQMLYVVAFVFVFVAGGITGVMVAMVPFDWQAHDTYFVVAAFPYRFTLLNVANDSGTVRANLEIDNSATLGANEIEFTVKVTNRSATRQSGAVRLTFADARSGDSVDEQMDNTAGQQPFDLPAGQSQSVAWRIRVPDGLGLLTYRAVGASGRRKLGSGEGPVHQSLRRNFRAARDISGLSTPRM